MAIEMPKFSASRPAWSMNGSRWRRVSHTASGPMTEPKGTMSPAKVDRWAATAVLRTASPAAPASVLWSVPPAARSAPQFGQLVACWSSLAEQAGQVLSITALLRRRPLLEAPTGTPLTIDGQVVSVVGPRTTLGPRPAGEAAARCHPPGRARLIRPQSMGPVSDRPSNVASDEPGLAGVALRGVVWPSTFRRPVRVRGGPAVPAACGGNQMPTHSARQGMPADWSAYDPAGCGTTAAALGRQAVGRSRWLVHQNAVRATPLRCKIEPSGGSGGGRQI